MPRLFNHDRLSEDPGPLGSELGIEERAPVGCPFPDGFPPFPAVDATGGISQTISPSTPNPAAIGPRCSHRCVRQSRGACRRPNRQRHIPVAQELRNKKFPRNDEANWLSAFLHRRTHTAQSACRMAAGSPHHGPPPGRPPPGSIVYAKAQCELVVSPHRAVADETSGRAGVVALRKPCACDPHMNTSSHRRMHCGTIERRADIHL